MATFLMVLFLIICLLLIIVVLLQRGRGGGLGSAFGGGAGGSAFGTRTGDVFTWVTIVLTALFLLLAVFSTLAVRSNIEMGKLPAPVLSETGPIEGTTLISMRCDTTGATIRYTINGREPTEKDDAYGKMAVSVKPGDTLRARAFRAGFDPSDVTTVTYVSKADAETPTSAPASQPASMPASQPAPATQPAAMTQPAVAK